MSFGDAVYVFLYATAICVAICLGLAMVAAVPPLLFRRRLARYPTNFFALIEAAVITGILLGVAVLALFLWRSS